MCDFDPAKKPKVSVIIPAHNNEETLQDAVRSVRDQTYPEQRLEILIVENGSTDKTAQIADALAAQYENVSALHLKEGDVSEARNTGIRKASGSYLCFVDGDDTIRPDMVATLTDLLLRTGVAIAQISRTEIAPDGTILPDVVIPPEEEVLTDSTDFLKSLLLHEGDASFCTKLTKRSLFTEERMFVKGRRNEDFELMIRMMGAVKEIAVSPKRCYEVRYRARSGSRMDHADPDYFPQGYTDLIWGADHAELLVKEHYPQLGEIACRFALVQRLDYLLHIPLRQMKQDNEVYRGVVSYLRAHRKEIRTNPYLSGRQRKQLRLLAVMPKTARRVHAAIMRSKNRRAQ